MTQSFSMKLDVGGLERTLNAMAEEVEAAARPAAQAGAQVLYEEVKRNVKRLGTVSGRLERAIYQVFSESASMPGSPVYHVSWNARTAPHGHLLEAGWLQRYEVRQGKGGKWITLVRPEMQGKPKPKRRAPQSVKDAYYVLRKGGPVQRRAYAFVRAAQSRFPQALAVAEAEFFRRMAGKGGEP